MMVERRTHYTENGAANGAVNGKHSLSTKSLNNPVQANKNMK